MLAANQRSFQQAWPFLGCERPVIVDWLHPHTFGNHDLNMMISSAARCTSTRRPVPALFGGRSGTFPSVPPTIYFDIPQRSTPARSALKPFVAAATGCGWCRRGGRAARRAPRPLAAVTTRVGRPDPSLDPRRADPRGGRPARAFPFHPTPLHGVAAAARRSLAPTATPADPGAPAVNARLRQQPGRGGVSTPTASRPATRSRSPTPAATLSVGFVSDGRIAEDFASRPGTFVGRRGAHQLALRVPVLLRTPVLADQGCVSARLAGTGRGRAAPSAASQRPKRA